MRIATTQGKNDGHDNPRVHFDSRYLFSPSHPIMSMIGRLSNNRYLLIMSDSSLQIFDLFQRLLKQAHTILHIQ